MYLHFIPAPVQWLFPGFTWHRNRQQKTIYLTFDDGPVPEVTPFVLDTLAKHQAKATFFCVGDNVRKHSRLFKRIIEEGHQPGNHTYHHLNGKQTSAERYAEDVRLCQEAFRQAGMPESRLFRPPYGRLGQSQARQLLPSYEIIMWDVLSADYDAKLSPEVCLKKSIRYTRSGSIIVFHDNPKAFRTLKWVLPRYLQHFSSLGYSFHTL